MCEPSAWADTCTDLWPDDWDIQPPDPRLHDLRGQGHHGQRLTEDQLRAITDIAIIRQEYL